MIVWILQTGEPLHSDKGSPRPMRAMNLANALIERGHHVVIWSSAFFHQEKIHRSFEFQSIEFSNQLTINLIPSMGYTRNIGIRRLIDHAQLAINLGRLLSSGKYDPPDSAFVGFPPIEIAAVMIRWLRNKNVPAIIDAKDQWPDIFLEPVPKILHPLAKLALCPYSFLTKRAMNDALEFCAMTSEFVTWMGDVSGRPLTAADLPAPLAAPKEKFRDDELFEVRKWWALHGVDTENRRRISFVGSLSPAFNFEIVRRVAQKYLDEDIDCQFVICGEGSESGKIRQLMAGLSNVVMPGWIDAPRISVLTSSSIAMMAPYINNDAFMRSIPNKIMDSFASNLPVITTLKGVVEELLMSNNIGLSTDSELEFSNYALQLLDNQDFFDEIVDHIGTIHDARYSYEKVYGELAERVIRLASISKVERLTFPSNLEP